MNKIAILKPKNYILLLAVLLFNTVAFAQTKYTISGYVSDAFSGEDVIGANVYIKDLYKGTTTNVYGFYSLTLPEGSYTIVYSFLGYQAQEKAIELNKDVTIDIEFKKAEVVTEEVVVTAKKKDANVDNVQTSTIELETKTVKEIPALLGEADIFRALQMLPGVMSAGEGNSGLYVRGGGPAQNLVLLDNATVYNPGHLLGFFSVFNADAIKNTTLYKGGIPSEFGGRISSVLDITMREGNMKKYEVEGGIGAISSRLAVHGPIIKDKASFIVSGRFTYLSFIVTPFLQNQENPISIPWFFDVNAKMNFKLGKKDRLFASSYIGRDNFSFTSGDGGNLSFDLPYGNATATLRWNHQFSDKLFMNNSFVFNDYVSRVNASFLDTRFNLRSGIRDYGLKGSLEWYPKVANKFKVGYEYIYHQFTPYITNFETREADFTSDIEIKHAHEFAIYAQDEAEVTSWLKLQGGLRLSMFSQTGPGSRIFFDGANPIDTVYKKAGQAFKTYFGAEPRLNARFKIDPQTSIKMGANLNYQYMHLVSSSTTTLPTDLWVPSTATVKPEIGVQTSLGVFRNFKDNMYETSIEGYYKRLWNQIEFGDEPQNSANEEIEDEFVFGDGHAWGVEFFVKKKYGKFNGWIGYTLGWTNRSFPDIDNGKTFFAKYDRRHDLSVVLQYQVHKRWKLNTTFIYGSGQAMTPVVEAYFIGGEIQNVYGERNSYRLPAYHRLDFGVTYTMKDNDKRYSALNIAIYNLYNRQNPYFIFNDVSNEGSAQTIQAKQVSLFPVLPSITWNFRF